MNADLSEASVFRAIRLDDGNDADWVSWVWHGYLARKSVTLLTSLWKAGKTTLVSVLLARLRDGGLFAGRALVSGRAVVVTEESRSMWQERHDRLSLGHVFFYVRPFRGLPKGDDWNRLLTAILRLHEEHRLDLVVIDPLATFLPMASEGLPGQMLQALLPLQRLTEAGLSVLPLHHPSKGEPAPGQAARGSGALPGYADIVLEMKALGHAASRDRRRRLLAFSRYRDTPDDLVISLNAAGTDYLARGDLAAEEFGSLWPQLQDLLERADEKLTRQQLLDRWPTPDNKPNEVYLWRLLERAVETKLLTKDGTGHKGKSFRYWLAARQVRPGRHTDLPPLPPLWPEKLEPLVAEIKKEQERRRAAQTAASDCQG